MQSFVFVLQVIEEFPPAEASLAGPPGFYYQIVVLSSDLRLSERPLTKRPGSTMSDTLICGNAIIGATLGVPVPEDLGVGAFRPLVLLVFAPGNREVQRERESNHNHRIYALVT
ncbi:hypothetical protein MSG28_001711 [Choristoneura fumiferana]|uniref:Uncharacterized protein n=1 Tax=Choristoneura fumiferana TaxID=7141 RepID=A0ACC0KV97_CHOFU|nr:hypothetical protein MSG28_001711 [Choristoneura fumiferana]